MAKNLGREFATMSEEERRRFALEEGTTEGTVEELDFENPRREDGHKPEQPKGRKPGPDGA